jgi:hypothetical protein
MILGLDFSCARQPSHQGISHSYSFSRLPWPVIVVSRFKMEIYTVHNGVLMTIAWANEEEFRLGQAFLKELVGGSCGRTTFDPDNTEFYCFENKQQLDALFDFRRDLRSRRTTGSS